MSNPFTDDYIDTAFDDECAQEERYYNQLSKEYGIKNMDMLLLYSYLLTRGWAACDFLMWLTVLSVDEKLPLKSRNSFSNYLFAGDVDDAIEYAQREIANLYSSMA